jgi:hypothetical protein
LDGFTLEDGAFHVLDHLLVAELHPVISFIMATILVCPMLGSRAFCISRSSWIFLSQSKI